MSCNLYEWLDWSARLKFSDATPMTAALSCTFATNLASLYMSGVFDLRAAPRTSTSNQPPL